MSPACAALIRLRVTPRNARHIERQCQELLCEAHAFGDWQDENAMRGKIWQCHEARPLDVDSIWPTLSEFMEAMEGRSAR